VSQQTGRQSRFAWILGVGLAAVLAFAPRPASAQDAFGGPLRIRDMTPFNLLRLEMLPAQVDTRPAGSWGFDADLSWANTFIMSGNVRDYLAGHHPRRSPLTQEDVDAIFRMGQDAYYVDGEFGLLDLTADYVFAPRSSIYLTAPLYDFTGGFLDSSIEAFHRAFSLDQQGRDLVARDRFQSVVAIGGLHAAYLEAPARGGLGDPVLGLRHSFSLGPRWGLVLDGAVKHAIRGETSFLSTGTDDFGVQAALQGTFARQVVYLSTSFVRTDGRVLGVRLGSRVVPTLTAAYEHTLTRHTAAIAQLYVSQSAIRDTNLSEIDANKLELSAGLRHRRGSLEYGLAVTENIGHFENTPDIAISASLAWHPPHPSR